ncbi:MAG: ComEC/Rec2 family competence protein [Oscillospiraceae bacterium]|nr:ComEC/Rec2 family competence protein [Oscillospiraceae bacterium]
MNKEIRSQLKLLPVRTAPFFAAGIILCADGGIPALIMLLASAVLAGAVFLLCRKAFASALALFFGMAAVMSFSAFVCVPILEADGTTQRLECRIVSRSDYNGYSRYSADANINGHITRITFFADDRYSEGDILTAEMELYESTYNDSPVRQELLNGNIESEISLYRPDISISRAMADFRRELSTEVAVIADEEVGTLAQGLLFGDTSDFPLKLRTASKISGVMHFTAVSGSHFVIIMSVLLQMINSRFKKTRAVASAICIPLAVLFFGAEPTVIRSGIMLFLCNCGPLLARRSDTLNSLCVSVLLMTVFTPYVVLDIGFQLSVAGVFGVSIVGAHLVPMERTLTKKLPSAVRMIIDGAVTSACAVVCTAPISVGIFGGISLSGVFATLALTPVFTAALALGVMFAVTGLSGLLLPLGYVLRAAYYIILFFGSEKWLWLPLDYTGADILALVCAFSLVMVAVAPRIFLDLCGRMFTVLSAAAVIVSLMITGTQRKIVFTSDGTSGAAVICMQREAVVLISGNASGIETTLTDTLAENGILTLKIVAAPDLNAAGARSLGELYGIYQVSEVITPELSAEEYIPEDILNLRTVQEISADGLTIACAKAGDTKTTADIVLYSGYKLSEPQCGAEKLAVYVSSRQKELPEGAVNISDRELTINL